MMFEFRGSVTSEGKVSATLDQMVMPAGARFSLSGDMTHGTKDASFGFGFSF